MQIGSVGSNISIKTQRADKKNAKGKASFHDSLSDTPETHPVMASSFVFGVDPLFADLNNPSRKKEAIMAGMKILDDLDRLRVLLLYGAASQDAITTLDQLQQSLSQYPMDDLDPELREILVEIETRAVVELAKARRL